MLDCLAAFRWTPDTIEAMTLRKVRRYAKRGRAILKALAGGGDS